jgi:gamma-glutamyltranspeptidase
VGEVSLYNYFFDLMFQQVIRGLQKIGHKTKRLEAAGSSVTGIARKDGKIYASTDFRREGITAGF